MEVLLSVEESSMVSNWRVYLCLEIDHGQVVLSKRRYEALADNSEFAIEDEDGNVNCQLPDRIDDCVVIGIEDDMVVGGELQYVDEDDVIRLEAGQLDVARAWCERHGFDRAEGFKDAWTTIMRALGVSGPRCPDSERSAAAGIPLVTRLRIRLLRWKEVPATLENDYPAEIIKEGDAFLYRAKGVTVPITENDALRVIGNPYMYYFSTALKLHMLIDKVRGDRSVNEPPT